MRLSNSQFMRTCLLPSKHLSWLLMALYLLFIAGCDILPKQDRVPEPTLPPTRQVTAPQPDTPLGHFIEQIAPFAQAEQRESGVPASFSIAQAIHESWKPKTNSPSFLASDYNNYHGIRCSEPKELLCVQVRNATTGNMDSWNSYSSAANGFLYHGRWLRQNRNYENAFNYTNDPFAFAQEVLRCYTGCKVPFPESYYNNIVKLINDYNLRQYDVSSPLVLAPQPSVPAINVTTVSATVSPATPAIPTSTPVGGRGKIAFTYEGSLWIMNADDGERTRITENIGAWSRLSWSPDGKKIAFTAKESIYVANVDRSGVIRLEGRPGCQGADPSWSPDGKRIAYYFQYGGTPTGVAIMDANGKHLGDLTEGASFPAWSPDGTRIAIEGRPPGTEDSGLYILDTSGNVLSRVADMGMYPDWSPDGNKIMHAKASIPTVIAIVDLAGESELELPVKGSAPSWSPDGQRIAFNGGGTIFTMNPDGSDMRELGPGYAPEWGP